MRIKIYMKQKELEEIEVLNEKRIIKVLKINSHFVCRIVYCYKQNETYNFID